MNNKFMHSTMQSIMFYDSLLMKKNTVNDKLASEIAILKLLPEK